MFDRLKLFLVDESGLTNGVRTATSDAGQGHMEATKGH